MMRKEISKLLLGVVRKAYGGVKLPPFIVEVPENPEHGDYSTNAALVLSQVLKKSPHEIGTVLAGALRGAKDFSSVAVAGPGFINFTVADDVLAKKISDVLKKGKTWGNTRAGKGKKVIVEYFQLNIAKRPHIGHLRSAVIGDSLKRMFLLAGYHTISDTHVGDWGTQFGILLLAFKGSGMKTSDATLRADPFGVLEGLYIKENERITADPNRRELAKLEFAKLERGGKENRKIWKWMVDVSMENLEASSRRLGLLKFNEHMGESAYEKAMPGIVKMALEKHVAKQLSDGAIIADLSGEGLDEAVLVKSDGATTYLLRDLATILYRKNRHAFQKNIYLVDVRQSHHFRQVFSVAKKLGFDGVGESVHVEFGFMSLPEGNMSTRKGNAISLVAVLGEAHEKALAVIREKNPNVKHADDIAWSVGLGAIKYFDLSHNRRSDIVFRWEDALSFEGNTGPYLQYTHARLKSILRKAKMKKPKILKSISPDALEHRISVMLLRLPEAIGASLETYSPNILANYLSALAHLANEFYHSHPVMQEADAAKRAFRFALVDAVAATLERGLWCLGIDAPDEM
ncbi:MAG: arginine--tRNA ligase [Candidatus Sungbacteria bacterium RIFCSPHIGHO2_02_FULL_51_29]|uniref:Arginine--tRNA ligase n=1 Tax=Candidatus Sungbacteria bacterium RIFCSPHIGHO2_02_FULL_51_29 TaxID=1802273 RepID=A0A1G2KRG1_9BACT|nr:MAG: arginine--tRNA ligase [Candidatus Sungbacteria bacterium RIFCSPHIGHO2_02_FULL_51_29]